MTNVAWRSLNEILDFYYGRLVWSRQESDHSSNCDDDPSMRKREMNRTAYSAPDDYNKHELDSFSFSDFNINKKLFKLTEHNSSIHIMSFRSARHDNINYIICADNMRTWKYISGYMQTFRLSPLVQNRNIYQFRLQIKAPCMCSHFECSVHMIKLLNTVIL